MQAVTSRRALAVAIGGATLAAAALLMVARAPAAGGPDLVKAMAFVRRHCPGQQRKISARVWEAGWAFNALYGNCRAEDGSDQHIWFFHHGRFIGRDAPSPSHQIIGLWRNDRTIAFMYVLYRQSDPNCCATGGGAIVRFRWSGKRVKHVDAVPPRAHTTGVRVGR